MKLLALDIETTGLNLRHGCSAFMVLATSYTGTNYAWEFEVDPFTRRVNIDLAAVNKIRKIIGQHTDLVFHNAKFDMLGLRQLSSLLNYRLWDKSHRIHDTQQLAHIYDSSEKKALKEQGIIRLNILDTKETQLLAAVKESIKIAKTLGFLIASKDNTPYIEGTYERADYWVPSAVSSFHKYNSGHPWHTVCMDYGLEDTNLTLELFYWYQQNLTSQQWQVYEQHRPLITVAAKIEDAGVNILPSKLKEAQTTYSQLHATAVKKLQSLVPHYKNLNHNSPKQLREILFTHYNIPPLAYGKDGPSTDKNVLKYITKEYEDQPVATFCKQLLEVRKIETTQGYLANYERKQIDGRLYSTINIQGTATVRMSSSDPNTTNVGKNENPFSDDKPFKLRQVFGPDDEHIWFMGDYSQFQIRIFAYVANDQYLLEQLANGADAHSAVACRMYQVKEPDELQRRAAKAINFGILFGAGETKIENMSGVPGSYKLYTKQFPKVFEYLSKCSTLARKYGYVETVGGYPLQVPRNARYVAANYVIQGTEGEIVKSAMIRSSEYLYANKSSLELILPVHDELVFEGLRKYNYRQTLSTIRNIMIEESEKLGIPASVDFKYTKTHWAENTLYELP